MTNGQHHLPNILPDIAGGVKSEKIRVLESGHCPISGNPINPKPILSLGDYDDEEPVWEAEGWGDPLLMPVDEDSLEI